MEEIFQSATDTELLVADILADLPRMISLLDESSILPKNWACKRKRSSSSSRAMTCSSLLEPLLSPPEPITAIEPAPPSLPLKLKLKLKLRVSREKRRFRECSVVVRKPETKSLPSFTVSMASDDDDDGSQNPAKKTRREELSENLSKVSQQRIAVAEGVEDAMQLYERVRAYELQLADKEKELKLCLEQELEACEKLVIIDDHWLALSLQPLQQ